MQVLNPKIVSLERMCFQSSNCKYRCWKKFKHSVDYQFLTQFAFSYTRWQYCHHIVDAKTENDKSFQSAIELFVYYFSLCVRFHG